MKLFLAVWAVLLLSSAVRIDEASYKLARNLYEQKRYPEAAAEFDSLIAKFPASRFHNIALYYGGLSWLNAGDPARSQILFARLYKAADQPLQKELAWYGLGQSYYHQKKYANTINTYQQFLTAYPDSDKADRVLYFLGRSWEERGEASKARPYYQQILSYYPRSPLASLAQKRIAPQPAVREKTQPQTQPEWQELKETEAYPELEEIEETVPVKKTVTENREISPQYQPEPEVQEVKKLPSITGRVEGLLLSQTRTLQIPGQTVQTQTLQPVVQTQTAGPLFVTNHHRVVSTNLVVLTNTAVLTQKVRVLDTEMLKLDNHKSQMQVRQEEIDRLRRLLEIKARLLELKEDAVRQKAELLRSTNQVVFTDEEK